MMNEVRIYTLTDPDTLEVRYVGKTKMTLHRRHLGHCNPSKNWKHYSARWLHQLKSEGKRPFIDLVEVTDEVHWIEREIFWIAFYRALGCPLTNTSTGGENGKGCKHSPETRAKIGNAHRGKKQPPEAISRQAAALRGRKQSPEVVAKRAISQRGLKRSLDFRIKVGDRTRGLKRSQESRIKMSNAQNAIFISRLKDNEKISGIDWRPDKKKWRARLKIKGIEKSLGHFSTKEEAIAARMKAQQEYLDINTVKEIA